MDSMDLVSLFMVPYQTGAIFLPEKRKNWDPGRLRSEDLLKTVYGASDVEVQKNLVTVLFLNQKIRFQKNVGAANALRKVSEDLILKMKTDPSLIKFLRPFTSLKVDLRKSTFNWRPIAGTQRLSTHSFGTAIDLETGVWPQYWLWDEMQSNPEKAATGESAYRNDHYIPAAAPKFHIEVIKSFEKYGFIWGGKWNHYDTMHFEYRPEFYPHLKINCSN